MAPTTSPNRGGGDSVSDGVSASAFCDQSLANLAIFSKRVSFWRERARRSLEPGLDVLHSTKAPLFEYFPVDGFSETEKLELVPVNKLKS